MNCAKCGRTLLRATGTVDRLRHGSSGLRWIEHQHYGPVCWLSVRGLAGGKKGSRKLQAAHIAQPGLFDDGECYFLAAGDRDRAELESMPHEPVAHNPASV